MLSSVKPGAAWPCSFTCVRMLLVEMQGCWCSSHHRPLYTGSRGMGGSAPPAPVARSRNS